MFSSRRILLAAALGISATVLASPAAVAKHGSDATAATGPTLGPSLERLYDVQTEPPRRDERSGANAIHRGSALSTHTSRAGSRLRRGLRNRQASPRSTWSLPCSRCPSRHC